MFRSNLGRTEESGMSVRSPARMRDMRSLLPFLLSLFCGAAVQAQWWKVQTSGIDSNLRGVSVAETQAAKGVPVPVVWHPVRTA
jgi:hypothetical protein